jgi:hypothetical protein
MKPKHNDWATKSYLAGAMRTYSERQESSAACGGRYYMSPRLVVCLLVVLAACEPYVYDAGGYPVPYRGAASAASGRPENCGTPDQPKRCPADRLASRKVSSTAHPDYKDRTY